MGQYHYVVNLDKRQYLHPHTFGQGLKLMEFGSDGGGTMLALAVLLAGDNGRGGGDFHEPGSGLRELVGSWAGDRVVIAGDYGDEGRWLDWFQEHELESLRPDLEREGLMAGRVRDALNLYHLCDLGMLDDISGMMVELLLEGGEPVSFSPAALRRDDPERAVRCAAMATTMAFHPLNDPDHYPFGGR